MIGRWVGAAALLACAAPSGAQDYAHMPVAAGTWSYQAIAGGSQARFVDTTGTGRLAIQCNKATRRVTISRTSTTAANAMQVWTDSATRALAARYEANGYRISADLAANDRLLDAIAFSRGRFAIIVAGMETLVVPAWPEPARVVEDCRI